MHIGRTVMYRFVLFAIMQQHSAELYFCTDCRAVYVGHHNPGEGEDDDHYTPPAGCAACEGGEFEEIKNA